VLHATLAAAVGLAASACLGSSHTTSTPRRTAGVETVHGISIRLPHGWTLRRDPVPSLLEPALRFAAGSWPLPVGGNGCAPSRAIDSVPDGAALVWLYEYAPGDFRARDFAPEPRRFRLGELRGPAECIGRPDYMIRFRAHGRAFQVEIILGRDAGRLRVTVTKLLSSILVHPPKGV
jgi:hypothetical protein